MQELRTIRLYGELGKRFGRVHKLAVNSAAEAVRAMCALMPGFEHYMMNAKDNGVAFSVSYDKNHLDDKSLHKPATGIIKIVPAPIGSKRGGLGQLIIGAVIVVASVVSFGATTPVAAGALAGGAGSGAAAGGILGLTGGYAFAANLGMAVALGGVSQLLSPNKKGLSSADSPDNGASYNFNGPVNTTAQGNPIPVLYGEMVVGSATISAGVYSENQV